MHIVGFIIRIFEDAQSPELQMQNIGGTSLVFIYN